MILREGSRQQCSKARSLVKPASFKLDRFVEHVIILCRCSEIPGNRNLVQGPRCHNNLGIKNSRYLIPIVRIQAVRPGHIWTTQLSVLHFARDKTLLAGERRVNKSPKSPLGFQIGDRSWIQKNTVGTLHRFKLPKRARAAKILRVEIQPCWSYSSSFSFLTLTLWNLTTSEWSWVRGRRSWWSCTSQ